MTTFNLTKNQYLLQRLDGKKRSEIAREQGIHPPALYPRLSKWGIRDTVAEDQEIQNLKWNLEHWKITRQQILAEKESLPKDHVTPENRAVLLRSIAATLESTDPNFMVFHVPIMDTEMPAVMPPHMSRTEAFRFGLTVLQAAITQTRNDIIDLTGETSDLAEKLQTYVQRQVQQFVEGILPEE